MKLFYFKPKSYGQVYCVMTKNKEIAYHCILNYLKNKMNKAKNDFDFEYYKEDYDLWKKHSINKLPIEYFIQEYDVGEVIHSEIA